MELECSLFGRPAPCSARCYEPLTLDYLEGTQLIEEVGECTLLFSAQARTLTSPRGLCVLFPQRLVMSSANFHQFQKSLKVRSSARHLADRFQVLLHSSIPRLAFLPCMHYSGLSVIFRY